MIKNIIRAYDAQLLNLDEAKSYIQRFLESSIQEIEASCEETSAHASEIMDRLDCGCECDCDCEPGYDDPDSDLVTPTQEEVDAKKEALSAEIAKLIKYFEL